MPFKNCQTSLKMMSKFYFFIFEIYEFYKNSKAKIFISYLFYKLSYKEDYLRGSESQLKIQISRHNIADEKISNLPITNSKNNITEN